MTVETRIQELLEQADPLRGFPDDSPEAMILGDLVDQINKLRAVQAQEAMQVEVTPPNPAEPTKRGPGRPKKGDQ
jgi:hypothetical protein